MNLPSGTQIIPHDKSLNAMYNKGKQASGGVSVTVGKIADTIMVNDQVDVENLADTVANTIASKLQVHSINQAVGAV